MATLDLLVLIAYMVGILGAGFGAMLWRRGTAAGAPISIAVGGIAVIALVFTQGVGSDAPLYAGLGLGAAVYIVVSLLSRPAVTLTVAETAVDS